MQLVILDQKILKGSEGTKSSSAEGATLRYTPARGIVAPPPGTTYDVISAAFPPRANRPGVGDEALSGQERELTCLRSI